MANSLNIQLTRELRRFIDRRASASDVYATPSEYIRDLVRRDMQQQQLERQQAANEQEIARILVAARQTPIAPLQDGFIEAERQRLKKRSRARTPGK